MAFQQTIMTPLGINATYWRISQVNACSNPLHLAAHIEVQGYVNQAAFIANPDAVLMTIAYDWPVSSNLLALYPSFAQFPFDPTYVSNTFSGSLLAAAQAFVMIEGPLLGATIVS